jgi:rhomboid protease GluP
MRVVENQRNTYGRPWFTYALTAIAILYWIVVCVSTDISLLWRLQGGDLTPEQAVAWGAFSKELVFQGQIWRIISADFLHLSTYHLISNVIGMLYLFAMAEKYLGWKRILAACLLSSVLYTLVVAIGYQAHISAGMSGWVMVGVGVLAGYQIYFYPVIQQRRIPFWVVFMVIIIASALTDRIMGGDTVGHMIGCGTGFLLTFYVFYPRIKASAGANEAQSTETVT